MIITYYGTHSIKIQRGDTTLALNPVSKDSSAKAAKFGADVVLVSLKHPDCNGIEQVTYGDKEPFVISGPGEYEVGGIVIRGFGVPTRYDGAEHYNTMYLISLEEINILHVGALATPDLPDEAKRVLENVDILIVPVGDGDVLSPSEAHKFATKSEARITIPVYYDDKTLKAFLKESGAEGEKAQDKVTLKKRDVDASEGAIIVLKAQ